MARMPWALERHVGLLRVRYRSKRVRRRPAKTHATLRNHAVNHRQGKRSLGAHPVDQEHRVLEEFI
jgi:hypothetical protein